MSEDGKTLNVSGGGGSGSGQFIVTVYNTSASGGVYEADKTYDEISAAIDSGAMVLVHYKKRKTSHDYEVYYNMSINNNEGNQFVLVSPTAVAIYFNVIYIYEENGEMGISKNKYELKLVNQT